MQHIITITEDMHALSCNSLHANFLTTALQMQSAKIFDGYQILYNKLSVN